MDDLQEQCAHELLGGNGVATAGGIDAVEQAVHPDQRFVDQQADGAQRMVGRNEVFKPSDGEQAFLHHISAAHLYSLDNIQCSNRRSHYEIPRK